MLRNGFSVSDSDISPMGEWCVNLENTDFIISVSHDRGGNDYIEIGAKARPRKGAHLRRWSLHHLRGFLSGADDHYMFSSLKEQTDWLQSNESILLKTSLINSDDLNRWAVKVSRKFFGQDKKA